jgi:hypothetical protein
MPCGPFLRINQLKEMTPRTRVLTWRLRNWPPRQCHELAVIYEKEEQRGNGSRATLAVARKMVAYILSVERRKQAFLPAEELAATAAAKDLPTSVRFGLRYRQLVQSLLD